MRWVTKRQLRQKLAWRETELASADQFSLHVWEALAESRTEVAELRLKQAQHRCPTPRQLPPIQVANINGEVKLLQRRLAILAARADHVLQFTDAELADVPDFTWTEIYRPEAHTTYVYYRTARPIQTVELPD